MDRMLRGAGWVVMFSTLLPSPAGAQTVARSFAELARLLEAGEYIVVVDRADRETWGRVADVSAVSLSIRPVARQGEVLQMSAERRTFGEADVALLFRSDDTGARRGGIYPASWQPVQAIPAGAQLTVALVSGERRNYRAAAVTQTALRVLTTSGQIETIQKSDVLRIERGGVDDPTGDGIVIGALIGAGAGAGLMAAAYNACRGSCDAPARGPMFLSATGFGAGVGAAVGWIADRLHKGRELVFPAVVPVVTRDRKGVAVAVRF